MQKDNAPSILSIVDGTDNVVSLNSIKNTFLAKLHNADSNRIQNEENIPGAVLPNQPIKKHFDNFLPGMFFSIIV